MMLRVGYRIGETGRREVILHDLGEAPARTTRIGGALAVPGPESSAKERRRVSNMEYQRSRRRRLAQVAR